MSITNNELAELLKEIHTLKLLDGQNPFRARAFDRAAQKIESMEEKIATYISEERLTDISGIGEGIAGEIYAYSETGTTPELDELRERIPPELTEWLNISGLGPKTIYKIHHELGITTIQELKQSCQDGSLVDIEGFGKKSAEKILRSIEWMEQFSERCLLSEALDIARPLYQFIEDLEGVEKLELAGSLRRSRETIGDIDILVEADQQHAESIMDAFVNHDFAVEILGHGATKSSMRTEDGRQVDLRLVQPDQFAAALMYFTGSKEHNVVMRQRARDRGYSLNEYGLFKMDEEGNVQEDQPLSYENESDIYQHLDLNWVPPEHREDYGEFTYYEEHKSMELVEPSDIQGVLHAHSTWSDGKFSIKQMAEACRERGYHYLGITDHSQTAAYAGGLNPDEVKRQWEEIDQLNATYREQDIDFKIFKGIESDILSDGSLDYPDELLEGFDFVIASVHSGLGMDPSKMLDRYQKTIEHPATRIIGHPTGRLLLQREGNKVDINRIIEWAVEHHTAIEINANPRRLDLDWRYGNKARDEGLMSAICPDAHTTDGIDDIQYGTLIARKAKFGPERILNTQSADELEDWFRED